MRRIAIIHFTAPPAPGGIETLIAAQTRVLKEAGHQVRVIAGAGATPGGGEMLPVPLMDPSHPDVVTGLRRLKGGQVNPEHRLARSIRQSLEEALEGCDTCWVHNALTVQLNPFLTVALRSLMPARPDISWVSWASDISSISAFVEPRAGLEVDTSVLHRVRWVTISEARRSQLSTLLALPPQGIAVIPPPLDAALWLGLSQETERAIRPLELARFEPLVLVPAKLLPHKGLEVAVEVARALVEAGSDPLVLVTGAPSHHEPALSSQVHAGLAAAVRSAGVEENVSLLSDAVDGDLPLAIVRDLVAMADAVLIPSHEEGFGLPLLEAAALRVPIVCRDIPPFREVAGEAATYFRAEDSPEEIAAALLRLAASPEAALRRRAVRSMDTFRHELLSLL